MQCSNTLPLVELPAAKQREAEGFTLIELLVVVAIIVALLAILLPSMGRAIEAAELAVCSSNHHQLASGAFSYASDNYGHLPQGSTRGWEYQLHINPATTSYVTYVNNPEVFYCPTDPMDPDMWNFQAFALANNWGYEDLAHLVGYRLYFMSGLDVFGNQMTVEGQLMVGWSSRDLTPPMTISTCYRGGYGVSGPYTGNFYPGRHRSSLPSAMGDGHVEAVPDSELIYDGVLGVEVLGAIRRPYIGQESNPHPQSRPVN